jgi:site-specific DNA-methyltransferase (adenine-specific)
VVYNTPELFKTYVRKTNSGNKNAYGNGIGEITGSESLNFGDSGSAARFFYCAKASKADRDEGCEGMEAKKIGHNLGTNACARCGKRVKHNGSGEGCECGELRETMKLPTVSKNHHPTVKPTSLMRYLCKLVTPPNGIILDPFMGSGSTGKAAVLEGFNFIGCDTEYEYVKIAEARINHALCQPTQPDLLEDR